MLTAIRINSLDYQVYLAWFLGHRLNQGPGTSTQHCNVQDGLMWTQSTFWLHSCPIINQGDWLRTNYPPDFTSGWRVSALVGEN
jgi:hypothetical protein